GGCLGGGRRQEEGEDAQEGEDDLVAHDGSVLLLGVVNPGGLLRALAQGQTSSGAMAMRRSKPAMARWLSLSCSRSWSRSASCPSIMAARLSALRRLSVASLRRVAIASTRASVASRRSSIASTRGASSS